MVLCNLKDYESVYSEHRHIEIKEKFCVGMLSHQILLIEVVFLTGFQTTGQLCVHSFEGESLPLVFSLVRLSWFQPAELFFFIYSCKSDQLCFFGSLPKILNFTDLKFQVKLCSSMQREFEGLFLPQYLIQSCFHSENVKLHI